MIRCCGWKVVVPIACLAVFVTEQKSQAVVLIDVDWQEHEAGTLLNTLPGWAPISGSLNSPVIQALESAPNEKFLTTGPENSQATRDAFTFINPGFFSGTTLTFTVDMIDPSENLQSGLATFPRAYLGIMESRPGGPSLPSYFGMEHDDATDDPTTAEWAVAGEDFGTPAEAPQMFTGEGSVVPDAWYTLRSIWNLGTKTKSLEVKLRDSAGPFTPIFSDVPIGFLDPNQPLNLLNSLVIRMNRGTRIDNILVEYDAAMAPDDLPGDYNGDNTVDAADYTIWRNTFGSTEDLRADGDGSGDIGQGDYDFWKSRFGDTREGSGSVGVVVPEPSTLLLGVIVATSLAFCRRRQSR